MSWTVVFSKIFAKFSNFSKKNTPHKQAIFLEGSDSKRNVNHNKSWKVENWYHEASWSALAVETAADRTETHQAQVKAVEQVSAPPLTSCASRESPLAPCSMASLTKELGSKTFAPTLWSHECLNVYLPVQCVLGWINSPGSQASHR